MMHYYYYNPYLPGTETVWNHSFLWPFVFVGAAVSALVAIIWIVLVVWMLIDLFTHDNKHKIAWALTIVFGNFMGPVGYYFIVKRDRDMRK